MKIFLRKTITFIILIFLFLLTAQIGIFFRIRNTTIRGIDNLKQTSGVNADLVFLGSSRCWAHFDPIFFNNTFNLKSVNIGVEAHSEISMTILRLKNYLSKNKPPNYAILSFDPIVNPGSENNNTNFTHKDDFARYSFLPSTKDLLIVNYFNFNLLEKYIPLYSIFKYGIISDCIFLKNPDRQTYIKYGYARHSEIWDTIANPVNDKMKKLFFKEKDIPAITKSLSDLNNLCQKNNIKLLCIQTPIYKSLQDDSAFSNADKICKSLSIPFIDANLGYIRNDINYFYNSVHLNKKGVDEMNKFLKKNELLISFLHE